jgi:type VI secretion system protein VasG
MAEISRESLFSKLDRPTYKAVEGAYTFAKLRGNPYVELIHVLHQILQQDDSDVHRIIRHFELEPARLAKELTDSLDRLPRGHGSYVDLSDQLLNAIERGWVYGSLMFGAREIRSGHIVIGVLKTESLRHTFHALSGELRRIKPEELADGFAAITEGSPEEQAVAPAQEEAAGPSAAPMGKKEALGRFTVDLTEEARAGKIDPVTGRDDEIRQVIDILMRRRQNNPILVGEAGVGKTAVVEGFALRIANGDVPPSLRNVSLRALDVGLLQAGASMKGEFEQRLRQVIEEVQASEVPIILFIDEAHTLIGAGGAAGTGDAANLLKPALARGTLRTVAATTWGEYKQHIEKDPALTRRFQTVVVDEPAIDKAVGMMRGLASTLEQHHRVQLLDEAIEAAVSLSHRYIPARQLPDKSVSVLDTACARVAVSQHATPAELEDTRRRIEALATELDIIAREKRLGLETDAREATATARLEEQNKRLAEIEARFAEEKALVDSILELRAELRDGDGEAPERLAELRELQGQLAQLQGDAPLILPSVDGNAVASVISDWTGIPLGRMVRDEIDAVLGLAESLKQRVIGQDHALEMVARRVQTSRAGLDNPDKPIGVFMLCGPSGVGKTETALTLAEVLYGGEHNVIAINMSEFQEAHTVSTLKGAPPGYKGYGQGGRLTEAVRRKPYSVVLLDEVEKAHPDVHEIFFQVFDKGVMEDSEGRRIDFRNTLILLTSNVGSDLIMSMCADPELMPEPDGLAEALRPPLLKVFPPALLGRLVVVPYYPLSDAMLDSIIRLQLGRIERRIVQQHKVPFAYDDEVVALIRRRCTELESGGRMIDAILTNTVLPRISQEFLVRLRDEAPVEAVRIAVENDAFAYRFDG